MKQKISCLAVEGGGAKGVGFGGVPEVLQELGILSGIEQVAGTSAGAILAFYLAVGANPSEIYHYTLQDRKDILQFDVWSLFRLWRKWGLSKSTNLESWLKSISLEFLGDENATFEELNRLKEDQSGPKVYRHLHVFATDMSNRKPLCLNHTNTPDMEIWRAVRASVSLPLIWPPVIYAGKVLADGGMAVNMPFEAFRHVPSEQLLGIRLGNEKEERYGVPSLIKNLVGYLKSCVEFLLEQSNNGHIEESDWERTIFIDTTLGVLDFGASTKRKQKAIQSGEKAVHEFFSGKE